MVKVIKIIYDKYENDIGFSYLPENQINNNHIHHIIEKINDVSLLLDRDLKIYTWGVKKHKCDKCDIIFDATLFRANIDQDVKNLTGLNDIIQTSIVNHPLFDEIMEKILTTIEQENPKVIGFICNYGKHRSVGWAELLGKLYYTNSIIEHIGLKNI